MWFAPAKFLQFPQFLCYVIELNEATKELEKATVSVENAQTSKDRLDASNELKKATARLEAVNYLS